MTERSIRTKSSEVTSVIFGNFDTNLKKLESAFGVKLYNRQSLDEPGDTIVISGGEEETRLAADAVEYLRNMTEYNETLAEQTVDYIIGMIRDGRAGELESLDDCVCVTTRGRPIKPKTLGQKRYVELIRKNTVVFGVGPAGTGKTFLAVAMAVKALREKEVQRIILTRPAVEAGEKLGFLPGDLYNKIDPYLRPLHDALHEMLGRESYEKNVERQTIEIAPLAYMRGRTLDDSFIILDEAQNTTPEQMKMFLTRLGFNSKAIVTGDLTQTDLPAGKKSGLASAIRILSGIDGIAIHQFTERDVVRHKLVQKIILAYDRYEREHLGRQSGRHENKDKDIDQEKKMYHIRFPRR